MDGRRFGLWVGLTVLLSAALVTTGVLVLTPTPPGQRPYVPEQESCLGCHTSAAYDPGGLHPAAKIGCEPCHLGDPKGLTAEVAHRGMEPEPGALRTAARTCGRCHVREHERVATSLMATNRGLIAVNRWAFGELSTPRGDQTVQDVLNTPNPTPAEDHLRRLCMGCHLGGTRDNRDDAITLGASGCSACHSPAREPTPKGATRLAHPSVDSRVEDDRCLGCHSRSGRISLGFQGIYEFVAGSDPSSARCEDPVTLHDGRAGCRSRPDVHHAAGMSCIDCHVHTELMGDGQLYPHEEEATEVRCEHCHGPTTTSDETTWSRVTDLITLDLLRQRGETRSPDERVRLGRRGTPIWNLRPDGNEWFLIGKLDGRRHLVTSTPIDLNHQRPGHERLTCSSCHDTEAPRCTTCHTTFDPMGEQWDFGRAAVTSGAWHETNQGMGFGPPTLGVSPDGRIVPTMPGMIATLDYAHPASPTPRRKDLRLHAAIVPHRTQKVARDCASCHLDPVALGLGSGTLDLTGNLVSFSPRLPGAPDRWTMLFPATPSPSTRVGGRSLDKDEQRRTLTVGYCLSCHTPNSPLWAVPFTTSMARLAESGAQTCEGRVAPWMVSSTTVGPIP